MLNLDDFLTLKEMHKQGFSNSEIARQTGYNRRTVSKYVKAKVPPRIQKAFSEVKQAGCLQGIHHPAP